jgi:hypothetical protein
MMSTVQRVLLMTALALYAGLVFVLDLITPLGVANCKHKRLCLQTADRARIICQRQIGLEK